MTTREHIISEINVLDESQLKQIAEFLDFIKFRTNKRNKSKNGNQQDAIFSLGKKPIEIGISDASENLDQYLY